jgi:hypothetical protein
MARPTMTQFRQLHRVLINPHRVPVIVLEAGVVVLQVQRVGEVLSWIPPELSHTPVPYFH